MLIVIDITRRGANIKLQGKVLKLPGIQYSHQNIHHNRECDSLCNISMGIWDAWGKRGDVHLTPETKDISIKVQSLRNNGHP